jgi:hypothetical protein
MPEWFSACWSQEAAAARSAARHWLPLCRAVSLLHFSGNIFSDLLLRRVYEYDRVRSEHA